MVYVNGCKIPSISLKCHRDTAITLQLHNLAAADSRYLGQRSKSTFSTVTAVPPNILNQKPKPNIFQRILFSRTGITIFGIGALVFGYDYMYMESSLYRNLKCIVVLSIVAIDYKLNFTPDHDIEALHSRVADRVFNLISSNGGLYIKIGQAIAMQSAVLPPVIRDKFVSLFDMAPQDNWPAIEAMFINDFGKSPDQIFDYIDHEAIASASIAQVHKAQLKNGEWVAVKIQHPKIKKQVNWDLNAYKLIMYIYDRYIFDMPIYFTAEYICSRLLLETDFHNEAKNAENLREYLSQDSSLNEQVHIPKIYKDLTSTHVLTSEWIDGVSLSQREELRRRGYSSKQIMDTIVNLFAAQIFAWGVVHCDPHPGNIIIRNRNGSDPSTSNGKPQVVLIDHGLYIYERRDFREQYCRFWKSMFLLDNKEIKDLAESWGIGSPELFASSVMLKPYSGAKKGPFRQIGKASLNDSGNEDFEQHEQLRNSFRNFIQDTNKIPLELIFLGRNMRIIQGCNQLMGSPVNRVKILANWASKSLATFPDIGVRQRTRAWTNHLIFRLVMLMFDLGFYISKFRQFLLQNDKEGFEDILERQLRGVARNNFGLDVKPGLTEG
ncbi:ABC1 family-domain-containing protein [Dipodascopsis uninucleata]